MIGREALCLAACVLLGAFIWLCAAIGFAHVFLGVGR